MPGFSVLHYLPEFVQIHVHWVSDAIQPSHSYCPLPLLTWSFQASGSFPMSQLFASCGQSTGVSVLASVFPMNIQGWFPLGLITRAIWRRKWQPTPVFLPGESHGQRSLMGCSPWCHKESDKTEQLSTALHRVFETCLVRVPVRLLNLSIYYISYAKQLIN